MIELITKESFGFFNRMVDELVFYSESSGDVELQERIRWMDQQAQKKGISFYEMVFQVLYKHDVKNRARQWLQAKN